MFRPDTLARAAAAGMLAAALGSGCVITFEPIDNSNGDGSTPASTITVRVVNQTDVGLEPQIYFSASATTADELFVKSNLFTRFGIFGRGLIDRFSEDSFTVNCSDARLIGTFGGRFVDNSGEPQGTGTQRVLTQEVNFNCGERITFIYRRTGGVFVTSIAVD